MLPLKTIISVFLLTQTLFSIEEKDFRIISFEEFDEIIHEDSDKIRIFNFWATWCAPCVKEMPHFQKLAQNDNSLELLFISMDDGRDPERVKAFIERRNISAPVLLLNDVDYNKWIDQIDASWSGAIPATLFVKPNGERQFHEGELQEHELQEIILNLKPTTP